jgi:hypothetical protein
LAIRITTLQYAKLHFSLSQKNISYFIIFTIPFATLYDDLIKLDLKSRLDNQITFASIEF